MIKKNVVFFLCWWFSGSLFAQEPVHRLFIGAPSGTTIQGGNKSIPQSFLSLSAGFAYRSGADVGADTVSRCPDPLEITLTPKVILIYVNTSWWLTGDGPQTDTTEVECACSSKRDILNRLRELLYQNRNKTILLATEHPLYDYGRESGHYSWKDHLFPLRGLDKRAYLPLPLVGSLYPLLHSVFEPVENRRHPLYKEMVRSLEEVFQDFPNVVVISSHLHGLKYVEGAHPQLIVGNASKVWDDGAEPNSPFVSYEPGYLEIEVLSDGGLRESFYRQLDGKAALFFRHSWRREALPAPGKGQASLVAEDSALVAAHSAYQHGRFYDFFMGANYRREWAMPVKLPLIRLSDEAGGLKPIRLGGGLQSTSLRLAGADGREYALRSVEKKPDLIVPKPFEGTIVRDVLDDVISSQHPYSALIVSPIAEAAGIPHAEPTIGVVAPDTALGMYQSLFTGKVALLEDREPLGKSDNNMKAMKQLRKDHDNSYDAENFLKARMVDLLLGDWDRHADQWRFFDQNRGNKGGKQYLAVPRDRDMVFYVTQGFFPVLIKRIFVMPRIYGIQPDIRKGAMHYLFKSSFLQAHPASQLDRFQYRKLAEEVKSSLTDSVLQQALRKLPSEIYALRQEEQFNLLKSRRDGLPEVMDTYYRFVNKIVDIQLSDKNESVEIEDMRDEDALRIRVTKASKKKVAQDTLVDKVFPKDLTKEIRIYLGAGDDRVKVNNQQSTVKVRLIGGKGKKEYEVLTSRNKIDVYDRKEHSLAGASERLRLHVDQKKAQTQFDPVNLYNTTIPLFSTAYNPDDGFFLGAGFRYTKQEGFRKFPYASKQEVLLSHAFGTQAFNVRYLGEWIHALGNADLLLSTSIQAPDNKQNFFGSGNESVLDRRGNFKRFYRARFDYITGNAALRWRGKDGVSVSIGPAFQYYHMNEAENEGRFISQATHFLSYDSLSFAKDKWHVGAQANYLADHRNNAVLPSWGSFLQVKVQGYVGLNTEARSYLQILPDFAFYKSLHSRQRVVFGNRTGGGISLGHPAFYQSIFLGSEGNLMGFRKFRFAGEQALYNNAELRLALGNFGNYLVNGQAGLFYFYDIGRVWQRGEPSTKWHQGTGPGVYIAPAALAVLRFAYGYTEEGWYPSFSMGWRF